MKLATIGTSTITRQFIQSVQTTGRFDYAGACSRSEERAEQFARQYGGTHWFTTVEQLAASRAIDLVYCASPNGLHFRQVKQLLQNGKHVICEKPIFANLDEFDEAVRIADEKKVYLFEAIRNIQTPVFQKLQQGLPQAGKIRSAVLQQIQYSSRYDQFLAGKATNIFSPQFAAGAFQDIGVYPTYAAIALFGEPEQAVYYPVRLANGIDGSGTLVLTYPGFVCTILCSKIAHSSAPSEIHGEKGTFRINAAADISRLEWIDAHEKTVRPVMENVVADDKIYEINHFADIIEQQDQAEYLRLRALSRTVVKTMSTARLQSGIRFPNDRD